MRRSSPTIDAVSFREGARERVLEKLIRVRLYLSPVLSAIALSFALVEATLWRRVVCASVVAMLIGVSVAEFVRFRRQGLGAILVPFNLLAMVTGQIAIITATGGLLSPAIPVLIVMTLVSSILVEQGTVNVMVGALELPAIWALAIVHATAAPVPTLVPALFGDAGALEHGPAPWIAASLYSFMLLAVTRVGRELRSIFGALFDEAMEERDRSLALLAEQSRTLTTQSAEIAHELKNPLASIKGLGALVARDVDGKTAERVSVLRREVDRMQGIVEEFLNFSRPLVPLALARTDLSQLARDVARLHEGTSSDRGVGIAVDAPDAVWIGCDPRKVRQMLINLVQNALEASRPGSTVRVVVESELEGARVAVLDRGAGIDPELADRVFEAGVTSKEQGSGLGLAVARSLARQHGGELTLTTRDGGGCEAVLTLPATEIAAEGEDPR